MTWIGRDQQNADYKNRSGQAKSELVERGQVYYHVFYNYFSLDDKRSFRQITALVLSGLKLKKKVNS